ncbi:hypothetical protein D9601_14595 [Sphingomonas sp. MA1305]|uniref:NepR family anti-sigma factor n=1 Tax=Sphingomonas sp. MA1305 TaxID=2479204 RepID=UPI001E2F4D48|nr:hypothetical protein [Sphingomonas sp. MA1305]
MRRIVPFAIMCAWIAQVAVPGHQGDVLDLASDKQQSDKDRNTSSQNSPKVQSKDRDMGAALRSAYQKTVDEHVPDEMLDLLNKLA